MKLTGKGLFSLFIALLMAILIINAMEFNSKARSIPIGVGTIVLIMSLLQFFSDTFPNTKKYLFFIKQSGVFNEAEKITKSEANDNSGIAEKKEEVQEEGETKSVLVILLSLVGFILLLSITTYMIAVTVFIFLFVWLVGKEKVTSALSLAVVLGIAMYLLFDVILGAKF
jgi:hypothetical protein